MASPKREPEENHAARDQTAEYRQSLIGTIGADPALLNS